MCDFFHAVCQRGKTGRRTQYTHKTRMLGRDAGAREKRRTDGGGSNRSRLLQRRGDLGRDPGCRFGEIVRVVEKQSGRGSAQFQSKRTLNRGKYGVEARRARRYSLDSALGNEEHVRTVNADVPK